MAKLESLKQPASLTKLAYDALLKHILSGQLTAGEVYNEKGLATDLGTSRTPVREALLELSVQGLVSFLPRKGVVVNSFSKRDIEDIFEVRRALEGAVTEKAALTKPPALKDCRQALEDQRKAFENNDHPAFVEANYAFHKAFGELTENQRIVVLLGNIRNMMELIAAPTLRDSDRMEDVVREHERIIEAIERGEPEVARKALVEHLNLSEGIAKQFAQ